MAQYEPLLDENHLYTELLKTLDHKSDVTLLKLDEFVSTMSARIEQLEATNERLFLIQVSLEDFASLKPALERGIPVQSTTGAHLWTKLTPQNLAPQTKT
uniref:DUF484 family protein n=1 Tax=Haemonchus contortus TaxID=6289 RepID=A0A7I5EDW7_HAECO